jgi:hypothetical protein
MTRFHRVLTALLCVLLFLPGPVRAQSAGGAAEPAARATINETSPSVFAEAIQTIPVQKQSTPGGRLLRNALIGAAIGGALVGIMARGLGDCGNCSGDTAKAIASGAMYGALVGAAINVRPSRRAWPSQRTTISSKVTRHVKAVNVAVRF